MAINKKPRGARGSWHKHVKASAGNSCLQAPAARPETVKSSLRLYHVAYHRRGKKMKCGCEASEISRRYEKEKKYKYVKAMISNDSQ